jgi:hypothetical protein
MTTHLGLMALFAAAVAIVFATLLRDDGRSQIRMAAGILVTLVVGGWLVGWLLYVITP